MQASYFDGRSSRIRTVGLAIEAGELRIDGEDVALRLPFAQVQVAERLGSAPRRLQLPDGAFCEVRDLHGLDALLAGAGHRDGVVDRLQRNLRVVLLSALACIAVLAAAYRWGLPYMAEVGAQRLPPEVGKLLSQQTLSTLDQTFLKPSTLPPARQQALETEYRTLKLPEGGTPQSPLLFRNSPDLGANAFTLPDGTIVLLDGLVAAMDNDRQVLAVLGHELGHAHGRHGLRLMLQSSAVALFWSFYVGDVSSLLATAPTVLMQARYSRELEQQADDYGAAVMRNNGLSPALLADALEKLVAAHRGAKASAGSGSTPGYLSSHPPTEERIRRLRAQAGPGGAH